MNIFNKTTIQIIKIYQKTLSPDHGLMSGKYPYGFCRHYPSCSQYAVEALSRHGYFKSLFLIVKRVLLCNPFVSPKINHP